MGFAILLGDVAPMSQSKWETVRLYRCFLFSACRNQRTGCLPRHTIQCRGIENKKTRRGDAFKWGTSEGHGFVFSASVMDVATPGLMAVVFPCCTVTTQTTLKT